MARMLARHDALMRHAIESHSGRVFKTMGDAFCAVFSTCRDAIAATLQAQRTIRAESWGETGPIKVRMALHTGEADERGGDYFGQPVNRVARLLSAAHGEQVLVSQTTADVSREALPTGSSLKDLGEHRLKDLVRAERIFQLLHPDLPVEFPAPRGLQSFPNNLPVQSTSFVGRAKELADVQRLLESTRLVTVKAMGGCGKTRLALQVGAEVLEQFSDGVWFVELAPITDGSLVVQAVATALGVKEEPSRPLQTTLLERLREGRRLLMLDNCEHLIESCAQLAAAIGKTCPSVKILATSREVLNVTGEAVYNLSPLATESEAVSLFLERARAANNSFTLSEQNRAAVLEICRQLDGIPLAIELAAARVRMLSPAEITTRLSDRFRLLTGGPRTSERRQQTLRALIDWSYVLLSEPEQALFRSLSVFAGGWTLEAAEAFGDTGDVMDLLSRLVDKSLVIAEQDRYRFLETVRQYAWEKAVEAGEAERLRARHLELFRHLSETAEPHLTGAEQQLWLDRLESEHDNLRAALSLASSDANASLRLAGALWRFWNVRGYYTEGRTRLEAALRGGTDDTVRAKALRGAGVLAANQADYAAAQSLYEQALAFYRKLGDKRGVAYTLNNLGLVVNDQSRFAEARRLFEESAALLEELQESGFSLGVIFNNLGRAVREQNEYAEAQRLLEQALTIRRQIGDQQGTGESLYNLGVLAREQGRYEVAAALFTEAAAIQQALGDKRNLGWTLSGQAELNALRGELATARTLTENSLKIFHDVGEQRGIASCLSAMGMYHARNNEPAAAAVNYDEALQIFRRLCDQAGVASVLDVSGVLALRQGELAAARQRLTECLRINRAIGNRRWTARSLETFAVLAIAEGDAKRAARLYGAAAVIRETIGAPLPPEELAEHKEHLTEIRRQLGDQAFAAALAEGRALTTEQAVVLAGI